MEGFSLVPYACSLNNGDEPFDSHLMVVFMHVPGHTKKFV